MSILRKTSDNGLLFWCVGCNRAHGIFYGGAGWSWDGNAEKPTFSPSVLVEYNGLDAGTDGAPPRVCHSFVKAGQIQYLSDCTHALAGQTIDMCEWPS